MVAERAVDRADRLPGLDPKPALRGLIPENAQTPRAPVFFERRHIVSTRAGYLLKTGGIEPAEDRGLMLSGILPQRWAGASAFSKPITNRDRQYSVLTPSVPGAPSGTFP